MLGDFPLPSIPGKQRGAGGDKEKKGKKREDFRAIRTGVGGLIFQVLKRQTHL